MKKATFLLFLSALLMLILSGCNQDTITYTVIFDSGGGSPVASISFDIDEGVVLPPNPTRDGYAFEGWYMDPELEIPFSIDKIESLNDQTLTLYAKWSSTDSELTLLLKHIYELALESDAFEGTYEEWLATIRGPQGLPGEDGIDGKTPYIGENGNWYIDQTDTGVFAGFYYPTIPMTGTSTYAVNSDGKSYYLLSYEGADRYVEIPEYYLGYPVTAIGPGVFQDNQVIEHVFISKHVQEIDDYAFSGATHLEQVTIDEGSQLESIGDYAFNEANALTSIFIPKTVTNIGDHAFYNAYSLVTVTIEEPSELTSVGSYAFADAKALTQITIPKGVTEIKDFTFYRASNLVSVLFEEGSQLQAIGNHVFYGTSSLSEITLTEGLLTIGTSAFQSSFGLESIHIPASVTTMGSYAFAITSRLATVTFAENSQLTEISHHTFYLASSLVSITIPASVTMIRDYAFDHAGSLETVDFEQGSQLQFIGSYAFSECHKLTVFRVPSGVTTIANYAFYAMYNLTTVYVPLSVTYVGAYVFHSSPNLTICVEAFSLPPLWNVDWNPTNRPVLWGYIWM